MKIGSTTDTVAIVETLRGSRASGPATVAAPTADHDDVAVSAAGAQMSALGSGDYDSAKVDSIRQAIREGRFTVNPEAIADRLIADAAALLAPRNAS